MDMNMDMDTDNGSRSAEGRVGRSGAGAVLSEADDSDGTVLESDHASHCGAHDSLLVLSFLRAAGASNPLSIDELLVAGSRAGISKNDLAACLSCRTARRKTAAALQADAALCVWAAEWRAGTAAGRRHIALRGSTGLAEEAGRLEIVAGGFCTFEGATGVASLGPAVAPSSTEMTARAVLAARDGVSCMSGDGTDHVGDIPGVGWTQ